MADTTASPRPALRFARSGPRETVSALADGTSGAHGAGRRRHANARCPCHATSRVAREGRPGKTVIGRSSGSGLCGVCLPGMGCRGGGGLSDRTGGARGTSTNSSDRLAGLAAFQTRPRFVTPYGGASAVESHHTSLLGLPRTHGECTNDGASVRQDLRGVKVGRGQKRKWAAEGYSTAHQSTRRIRSPEATLIAD